MGQKHLQLAQRVQIETLLKEGHNLSYIANTLGYSKAAITKEIQRATNHATMGRTVSTRISRRMYKALEGQSLADQKQRLKKSTVKAYAAKDEINQRIYYRAQMVPRTNCQRSNSLECVLQNNLQLG